MSMSPEEIQTLSDSIGKSVARNIRSPSPGGAAGAGPSFGGGSGLGGIIESVNPLAKLTTVTNGVVTAFSDLAKGTYTVNEALSTTTGVLSQIPGVGNMIGTTFQKLGETALEYNDSLRQSSKSGAYFDNNLGQYAESVLGARMSLKEWNTMIERSAGGLSHLGSNMDQSSLRFLTMAKQMQELPIADVLRRSGMGLEEFNDYLNENLSRRKFIDFGDQETRKRSIDSAIQLATEMDNIARLTGMSRAEQMKAKEAIEERPDVQLLRAQLDVGQQETLDRMEAMTATMGPSAQRAFAEAATGGIRTKEGSVAMAALGEAGPAILKATQAMQSTDVAERERGIKELEAAKEAYMRMHQDRDWQRQTMLGALSNDPVMQARAKMFTEDREAAQRLQQEREAAKRGISVEEYQKELLKGVSQARLGVGPEGEISAEAAPARAMNEAIGVTKDMMAGTGSVLKDLNSELGTTITGFQGLNKYLRPYSQEESRSVIDEVKKTVAGATGAIPTSAPGPGTAGVLEEIKGVFKGKPIESASEPKREGGSISATGGKLIEDWGVESLIKVHKKEGVITDDQISEMYKNTQSAIGAVANRGIDRSIPTSGFMPGELSISDKSIKDLMNSIKGPTDELGSRLEKLSINDIDKILSNFDARTDLAQELNSVLSGKPMVVEPIIEQMSNRIEKMTAGFESSSQMQANTIVDQFKNFEKQPATSEPVIKVSMPKIDVGSMVGKVSDEFFKGKESVPKSPPTNIIDVDRLSRAIIVNGSQISTGIEKLDATNKTIGNQVATNITPGVTSSIEKINSTNVINKELSGQLTTNLGSALTAGVEKLDTSAKGIGSQIVTQISPQLSKLEPKTPTAESKTPLPLTKEFRSKEKVITEKIKEPVKSIEASEKLESTLKAVTPELKNLSTEVSIGTAQAKVTATASSNPQIADSLKNISSTINKPVTKPVTVTKPVEPSGFGDKVSNMLFDIGNFAGKQYDSIAKTVSSTMSDISKSNVVNAKTTSTSISNEGFKKTLTDLGVTPMLANTAKPEVKEPKFDLNDQFTKVALETAKAFKTSTPTIVVSSKPTTAAAKPVETKAPTPVPVAKPVETKAPASVSVKLEKPAEQKLSDPVPVTVVNPKPTEPEIKTVETKKSTPVTVVVPKPSAPATKLVEPKPTAPSVTPAAKPIIVSTPKISTPVGSVDSIKNLFSKSVEIAETGDTKRSKIYADAAARQSEQIKTSLASKPVIAKSESPIASLGIGKDIAAIKERRSNEAYINERSFKEVSNQVRDIQSSVVSKIAQEKAVEPKTSDFESLVTKVAATKPVETKTETPKPDLKMSESSTMTDIKMELVMLNKNMRELIAHTYDVADTAKHQVRATKKATTNNMLG